jgi:hypothetical protein
MWKALILLICIMFVLPAIVAGVSKSELKIQTVDDIKIERVQEVRGGHGGYGHGGYGHGGYGHGGYGHYYYPRPHHFGCVPPPIL